MGWGRSALNVGDDSSLPGRSGQRWADGTARAAETMMISAQSWRTPARRMPSEARLIEARVFADAAVTDAPAETAGLSPGGQIVEQLLVLPAGQRFVEASADPLDQRVGGGWRRPGAEVRIERRRVMV